jgi:hypothetical protein
MCHRSTSRAPAMGAGAVIRGTVARRPTGVLGR